MIELKNVSKCIDSIEIVNDVSLTIDRGKVCGLVGTNGAGKSTLLRMVSGIMRPSSGDVMINGESVFENVSAKEKIFHLQDRAFYFSNASLLDTAKFYSIMYKNFDMEKVLKLNEYFGLDLKKSLKKLSKGMQRQASIILALASNTSILLLDESFDGLDPMFRKQVKKLIMNELKSRDLTLIVTSQNLHDLEGLCDSIVILHKGNVVVSKEIDKSESDSHSLEEVFLSEVEAYIERNGGEMVSESFFQVDKLHSEEEV